MTLEQIQDEYAEWAAKVQKWETALANRKPVKVLRAEIAAGRKRMSELKALAAEVVLS